MLVDLCNSLKEFVKHQCIHLTRPGAVQFADLLGLRHVAVESAELAASVPKQYEEVFGLGTGDLLHHLLFGIAIHCAREDTVFDGIQDDAAVRFGCGLFVQFWSLKPQNIEHKAISNQYRYFYTTIHTICWRIGTKDGTFLVLNLQIQLIQRKKQRQTNKT